MSSETPLISSRRTRGGACRKVCKRGLEASLGLDVAAKFTDSVSEASIDVSGVSQSNMIRHFLDENENCASELQ